ncbi:HAMP domain-containing sensor histidine kinase [Phytopseudomonas dryadis]|uniref:histidine kinase n=1 Tax=Phytopseudomonas dryadis TaxID=2487520 RepID=A0A4Q9R4V6_9GAMM|nr:MULTISPECIES: HAMP domain-containing sensor histidine kinase [Pseudomonas]TBU94523.1 two-component sensor histidine kinase [Pseudomonas dryadis]TBU99569.1 two-component sensor histidine kinase [Pseudomonas dryadis]TBV12664.1 two-component sensor histidine kinase [Pseudomonas sp. FRB 230]
MVHQLGVLLVLALLASHAIAVVLLQRTGALLHPLSRSFVLERLNTAYQALDTLGEAQGERVLVAMSGAEARFWIAAEADVGAFAMHPEERRLTGELARELQVAASTIHMQLERVGGGPAREDVLSPAGWEPLRLRSSIELASGRYLNALQHPSGAYEWSRLLAYALPVSIVPILLILLLFMARVVRPFRTLATATELISRGERIAPLALSGPREARELSQAFNRMQERLARHVEGRTRMLAALSHDLNTPLTELRLQLELLEEGALREDLLDSLDELRAMVAETLDFIRDDAVQEPTVRLSLSGLLDDLARRYRTLGQPVAWQAGREVFCRCRPLALKRALTNLIDNALQHGGDASISLDRAEEGELRLQILDHGPGIDPARLEQAFEPFVQLQAEGRGQGLGLGLAIARACVRAHGGELTLENRQPTGLCAVVRLPEG